MVPFSICLIARNEGKTLPRLLSSLSEFVAREGDIIVLDTGSRDDTIAVAESHGARVVSEPTKFHREVTPDLAEKVNRKFISSGEAPILAGGDRLFHFAEARNYCATLAQNDWVATPDCDEAYTCFDIDAICLSIPECSRLEYRFIYAHDKDGKPLVTFNHSKFYNRNVFKWEGRIHEVLAGDGVTCFVPEHVIKLEHFQNRETSRDQYLKGMALSVLEEGESNVRNLHYFGRDLLATGRPYSAITQLMQHVECSTWNSERCQSMMYIAEAFERTGRDEIALRWLRDAAEMDDTRREPWIRMAYIHKRQNSPRKVLADISAALTIPPNGFYNEIHSHFREDPHHYMYWALFHLGDRKRGWKTLGAVQGDLSQRSPVYGGR